jgi:hypothetical protein
VTYQLKSPSQILAEASARYDKRRKIENDIAEILVKLPSEQIPPEIKSLVEECRHLNPQTDRD